MDLFHFDLENPTANAPNSNRNGARSSQKDGGAISGSLALKKSLKRKLEPSSTFDEGIVTLMLPLVTVSEANNFDHWTKKHKRHRYQQKVVALALNQLKCQVCFPCVIKLTRFAPKKLDKHDNLPISMKYILDAVCAIITGDHRYGRADDDERITIQYDQETSKLYGVKIEISF